MRYKHLIECLKEVTKIVKLFYKLSLRVVENNLQNIYENSSTTFFLLKKYRLQTLN